jgi:hypothetical protein
MSLFSKLRSGNASEVPHQNRGPLQTHSATAAAIANLGGATAGLASVPHGARISNGLKEFVAQLHGVGRGHLLDLGPARQTTVTFFIERGFKVYTEDLMTTWKSFLDADEERKSGLPQDADRTSMTPAFRAERFLESTLGYPNETFDGVLMWDLLDYLDSDLVTRLVKRVTSLVRDGGVVLAIFHARKPEAFHRYCVLDGQHVELIPALRPFAPQHVYQNREISNLFSRFRSSKMFVGRDQFREGLFLK